MTWAIKYSYGSYEAVEVVKETDKMVFYIDTRWRKRETRTGKDSFYEWRGNEGTARRVVAQLFSAKAEYDRRTSAAAQWFANRRTEIFVSAQGMAPEGRGREGCPGSSELPSPVVADDAPKGESS